jgi:hypothetical protein
MFSSGEIRKVKIAGSEVEIAPPQTKCRRNLYHKSAPLAARIASTRLYRMLVVKA